MSDTKCVRFNRLACFVSQASAIYALGSLPLQLDWGKTPDGSFDNTKFICFDEKPIRVWVLSDILAVSFMKNGNFRLSAGVRFRPILQNDRVRLAEIEAGLTLPVPREHIPIFNRNID